MNKKIQTVLSSVITVIGISLLGLVAYFAFIFPKTIRLWQEQGRALSGFEMLQANFSNLCTSFGIILIPLCAIITIAGFIWLILSLKGN